MSAALQWHCLKGVLVDLQADEKARLEAEAQEKLDAAKGVHDALREANAAKIEAVEAAVAAWDAAAVRKNVSDLIIIGCRLHDSLALATSCPLLHRT